MHIIDRFSYLTYLEQEHPKFRNLMAGILYGIAEGRCQHRIIADALTEFFKLGAPPSEQGNIIRHLMMFIQEKSKGSNCWQGPA